MKVLLCALTGLFKEAYVQTTATVKAYPELGDRPVAVQVFPVGLEQPGATNEETAPVVWNCRIVIT
jgi:hypothetical protein